MGIFTIEEDKSNKFIGVCSSNLCYFVGTINVHFSLICLYIYDYVNLAKIDVFELYFVLGQLQ